MIYRFADFELDESAYELRHNGVVLRIFPKSFDVLRYLVKSGGRVVSKDELLARVWAGEYVSDSVLAVNVRTIRRLLAEHHAGTIIDTVRIRGYRIVVPIREVSAGEGTVEPHTPSKDFFGRDATLEVLCSALRAAEAGSPGVVLLHGEGGIGKSRLLREFSEHAQRQRVLVIETHCRDDPGAPPYWPIFQQLQSADSLLRSDEFSRVIAHSHFDLERARARIRELSTHGFEHQLNPEAVRFRLTQTLFRAMEELASVIPICALIDDLHAADPGSLRVITDLVRRTQTQRVLIVGTYRDSEVGPDAPILSFGGDVGAAARVRRVPILGLEPAAIAACVESHVGFKPSQRWLETLAERTGGNPFFVLQTLRFLSANQKLSPHLKLENEPIEIPETVRDVLKGRFARCTDRCQELLRWAAVIGSRVGVPVLEQVSQMLPEDLFAALKEALDARILSDREVDFSRLEAGEYRFTHALLRETLYEELTPAQRFSFHRAVGEALEALGWNETPEGLSELAHHFSESAPSGTAEAAISYAHRAAEVALRTHAYDEAVSQIRRALRAEKLRTPPSPTREVETRLALADALWRTGAYKEAEQEFDRVCKAARGLARFDLLGRAALGRMAWPRQISVNAMGGDRPAAQWFTRIEEALASLPDTEVILRSRLIGALARGAASEPARIHLTDRAIELARHAGSSEALLDALAARLETISGPDRLAERLEQANEALDIARKLGSAPLVFRTLQSRIELALTLGDLVQVDRDLEEGSAIASELRVPIYDYTIERYRILRALGDGRRDEVRERCDRVLALGRRATDQRGVLGYGFLRLWLQAIEGSLDEASPDINTLVDRGFVREPFWQIQAALFYVAIGDLARCRKLFEAIAIDDFSSIPRDDEWLWNLASTADACVVLGDRPRAECLYSLLLPYSDLNCVHRFLGYRGAAAYSLAVLARLLDRPHAAREHFEWAIDFNRRIGLRSNRLLAERQYARLLAEGPLADPDRCAKLLEGTEAEAKALGIEHWLERYS